MSAGWGPDPWGRFGFRWYTDLGWTEHVSDGTGRFVDAPGDRPTAAPPPPTPAFDPPPVVPVPPSESSPMSSPVPPPPTAPTTTAPASPPSAPTATSLPPIASVRSARVAEPVAATTAAAAAAASTARPANPTTTVRPTAERPPHAPATAAPVPPQRDRLRWVWMVAAMVVAFVLGAVVFGGDDEGDDDGDSAAETTVETTVVETVPPTVATTVPETVPPTPPPTTAPPDPEQVARNDRQIDDLEWGIITSSFAPAFGIEPPPRETAVTLGNQLCDTVASVSTPEELDLALVPVVTASGLPVGQALIILGAFGALMCEDTLEALGIPVTY